jgi:endonuclease/exonuclease/phosphatase family metal-dependent hydrolase
MVESQGADVVLLQEVYRTVGLRADQWLADRLAMNMLYSRANGDETAIGFEEGVALLSRYPLRVPRVHQLGGTLGFSRRVALAAEVHTPMGALLAVSTHLSFLLRENRQQWEELRAWVEEISVLDPAVIAGDFNADEGSAQMRDAGSAWIDTYRSVDPEGDGTTFEFRWPWGGVLRGCRFDYIFLRPGEGAWEVLDARVLHSGGPAHSDHRAVLATLTSEPTTEQGGRVTGAPHAGVSPP